MKVAHANDPKFLGSAWTDFRNSVEDKITGAGTALMNAPSTPPATVTTTSTKIMGVSPAVLGILGVGGILLFKFLRRRK